MDTTQEQYNKVLELCAELFKKKTHDYGTAWRILRITSLTDQIFIKAQRLRSIENKGKQLVGDSLEGEYIGIINYSLMALVQLELGPAREPDLTAAQALEKYRTKAHLARDLMLRKNHDYGEAWREMRLSSLTDLILQKLLRLKQIEDNAGKTIASEGAEASYFDMVNYAAFALIKMDEQKQ
jgi:hypothetical protein